MAKAKAFVMPLGSQSSVAGVAGAGEETMTGATGIENAKTAPAPVFGGSYQIAQSIFAQADGGLLGRGFGQAMLANHILPAPQTDTIYAVIVNELGLVGACGVLVTYLLIVERGFKTAMIARDSFSKLLASGLAAVFGLQVFVIVGGVTRVIPLTGVTLPFISYGGSSILANFVLVALLLIVSNKARQPL